MNEIALSDNLAQIEYEIKFHAKQAGQSIWEIGRRLNHVKEHDLAHGKFLDWLDNIGISRSYANRFMKIAKELPNVDSSLHIGVNTLYQIALLPDEEQTKMIERINNNDIPTNNEVTELKRQLKLSQADNERLKVQNEKLAEQALSKTEKVVEKEVIPHDYKATQDLNKQLLGKNKDLADELESVKRSLRLKKASYEMLEKETSEALALKESIEHLRADKEKLENSVTNIFNLSKLVTKFEDFFDEEMAPLRFKTLIQGIGKDAQIEKLRDILTLTENWLDEMNKIIPERGRTIIEGEIINE